METIKNSLWSEIAMPNICMVKFKDNEVPCSHRLGDECVFDYQCKFQREVDCVPFPKYLVVDTELLEGRKCEN